MREKKPSEIANRYLSLLVDYAENFKSMDPEKRLQTQKRVHNMSKMVKELGKQGLIQVKGFKTKRIVWEDPGGDALIYEV